MICLTFEGLFAQFINVLYDNTLLFVYCILSVPLFLCKIYNSRCSVANLLQVLLFCFYVCGQSFFFYMFFTCISYIKCMVHKYMCTRACVRECVCMYCTPTRQGRQCESETTSKSLESFAIRIACHYRAHLNIHISISLPALLLSLPLSLCVCFPSPSVGCAVGVRMSDKSVLHCDIVPYTELNIFTISFLSFFLRNTQKATKNAINYEVLPENYFSLALARIESVLD